MSFEHIIGNRKIQEYLIKTSTANLISQSYLFVGTEGIGKLLMAKEFAKKVLCLKKEEPCECKSCKCFEGQNHPDFYVLNESGDTIKIDQIREITRKIIEPPIVANRKVYIINDCEEMTVEAQNCLLKTLEEPPEFAVIILVTSRENLILNTIKSRCMMLKFKNIPNDELKKYAMEKLGFEQVTEDLLESFNGNIKEAIFQKQIQDELSQIRRVVDDLATEDITTIMNEAKVLYNKDDIDDYLPYLSAFAFRKGLDHKEYLGCVEKVKNCNERLKRNCNFDMCIDTMLLEMWECVRKGM